MNAPQVVSLTPREDALYRAGQEQGQATAYRVAADRLQQGIDIVNGSLAERELGKKSKALATWCATMLNNLKANFAELENKHSLESQKLIATALMPQPNGASASGASAGRRVARAIKALLE